ncbi:hypothetical protein HGB24_01955 [Candidatus Saccharibacteria bacterium]|nr:hypothetical protein [Candidatus Saccharibacteria bacterium]
MNPQSPYQMPTPTPVNPMPTDYLNQIAPSSPQKKGLFNGQPILLLSIIAIALLIFVIVMSIVTGNSLSKTEILAARLKSTANTVDSATSKIKSSDLRALNSNLKLQLTNIIRDITPILAKESIKIDKLSKTVLDQESNTAMLAKLEDARLNVIYDNTYAREMAYQLSTVLNLMTQVYNSTSKNDLQSFLKTSYANLKPLQKQFADFNLTTD